jgi:hypothetical protein
MLCYHRRVATRRHNSKASCVATLQPLWCAFKKSKYLHASRSSLSMQLLLNLSQFSILCSNEQDINRQAHRGCR